MDVLKEYIIPFKGLKQGEHHFVYRIDNTFLTLFDSADIENCSLIVDVDFTNKPDFLFFRFNLKGTVTLICDRCLDEFEYPINSSNDLYVRFADVDDEGAGDMVILPPSTGEIDLSPYVYENIVLALPFKRVHETEEQCNREMIEKLREHEKAGTKEIDPRWEELKKILNK